MTRALELYSGIGGFAAAVEDEAVEIVAAYDASSHVVQAYNRNWEPPSEQRNIMSVSPDDLAGLDADLWWMSPPCAPYTRRGKKRDLDDRRAESFKLVLTCLSEVRPRFVALENVEGFADSQARDALLDALEGYQIVERILCPTELGVPNKRPRYYLVAGREGLTGVTDPRARAELRDWRTYLDPDVDESFRVPVRIVERYGDGFHVMDDDETYTTCFTGSYGKSWNFTGSYLRLDDGGLRRFTPREVRRFLHFPEHFEFPDAHRRKQRWKYAGNSLSVVAVQEILRPILASA